MRILGLDVGDKRIGIAISDEMGYTAQGLPTLHRTALKYDLEKLIELIDEWAAEKIVAGLPRNMNGTYGPQSEKVKEFIKQLQEQKAIEVIYQDERLTTVSAHRVLLDADVSRSKRKTVVDQLAAVLILQSYLDSRKR